MIQALCIYVCKWKMRPVKTIPGKWGGWGMENGGSSEFIMIYLIYFKNFCKYENAPQNNKKRTKFF
jgi:hypothetical protein